MKSIRYFYGSTTGFMDMNEVTHTLKLCEKIAAGLLKKHGADHVIYASKEYDNESLVCVNFYNPPIELDDAEFNKRVEAAKDYQVYALHKRVNKVN